MIKLINNNPYRIGRIRLKWVDVAKALGLFLVFWGHLLYGGSPVAGVVNKAIYSFHMPMYFILSGYVMKNSTMSFLEYIKNKFNKFVLPALLLYFITLPIYFYYLDFSTATVKSIVYDFFYIKGRCAYNDPIWFFFCLFQVIIIAKLLKLTESSIKKLLLVAVITLIVSFLCYLSGWKRLNFFGFDKCLLGLFFFVCGMLLKRVRYEGLMKTIGLMALPIWIIAGVGLNTKVSMYGMRVGSFGLFIVSGLTGSLSFFAFSKFFENYDNIRQYAKWTIFIVCSHYVLCTLFYIIANKLSFIGTYYYDFLCMVYVLIALALYNPVCVILERHMPVFLGKTNATKNYR